MTIISSFSFCTFILFPFELLSISLLLQSCVVVAQGRPGPVQCNRPSVCYVMGAEALLAGVSYLPAGSMSFLVDTAEAVSRRVGGSRHVAVGYGLGKDSRRLVYAPLTGNVTIFLARLEQPRVATVPAFGGSGSIETAIGVCGAKFARGAPEPWILVLFDAFVPPPLFKAITSRYIIASVWSFTNGEDNDGKNTTFSFFPNNQATDPFLAVSVQDTAPSRFAEALVDVAEDICGHTLPSEDHLPSPTSSPHPFGIPYITNEKNLPQLDVAATPDRIARSTELSLALFVYQQLVNKDANAGLLSNVSIEDYRLGKQDLERDIVGFMHCRSGECAVKVTVRSDKDLRQKIMSRAVKKVRKQPGFKRVFVKKWKSITRTRVYKKIWAVQFPFKRKYIKRHSG